jgi:DNA-binding NarL/FixJ family response regulator
MLAGEPAPGGVVSVLIVDDSPAYLGALRDVVVAAEGFDVVAEAGSGEEAVELAAGCDPDLVLMDVRLPGIGGIEAGARIRARRPGTVMVLLSSGDEDSLPGRATAVAAATLDKRLLSPATLAELWSAHGGGDPGPR